MRFGIVGLSLSHPYTFAKLLQKLNHEVAFVWDYDYEKARDFGERFNIKVIKEVEDSYKEHIDGVFIEVESHKHVEVSIPFVERKIPLFIDKIMALNIEDLERIIALSKQNNSIIMTSSAISYKKEYREVNALVSKGEFGQMISATSFVCHDMSNYLKEENSWQDHIEKSGGELLNFGIHGIEPVYNILGPGIEHVEANSEKVKYEQALSEDSGIVKLKFNNGSIGVIILTAIAEHYGFNTMIIGTKKKYFLEEKYEEDPLGYEAMTKAFIEGIENNTYPIALNKIEELIKAMIAIRISIKENRRVYLYEV